jgi:hypothetical protein
LLALTNDLLNLAAHSLERNAQRLQRLGGNAFAFMNQTQEDVLSPDVVVVEHAGFFLSQNHHTAGPVGKPLEHDFLLTIDDFTLLAQAVA